MKALKSFLAFWQMSAIFCGLYLEKWAEKYLIDDASVHPPLLMFALFVGLAVIIKALDLPFIKGVEKSRRLRRLILGDDYIEGVWFNKIKSGNGNLNGLVHIYFSEGDMRVSGEQYNEEGQLTATWHSTMSEYSETHAELSYAYKSNYFNAADPTKTSTVEGISKIRFIKAPMFGIPRTYEGTYEDNCPSQQKHIFLGKKIESAQEIADLRGVSTKKKALKELAKEKENER